MSRGFGWVQTAALVFIYEHRVAHTYDFAQALFGPEQTASDIASLRRSLRRLRKDGLLASCRRALLWIMPRGVPARLAGTAAGFRVRTCGTVLTRPFSAGERVLHRHTVAPFLARLASLRAWRAASTSVLAAAKRASDIGECLHWIGRCRPVAWPWSASSLACSCVTYPGIEGRRPRVEDHVRRLPVLLLTVGHLTELVPRRRYGSPVPSRLWFTVRHDAWRGGHIRSGWRRDRAPAPSPIRSGSRRRHRRGCAARSRRHRDRRSDRPGPGISAASPAARPAPASWPRHGPRSARDRAPSGHARRDGLGFDLSSTHSCVEVAATIPHRRSFACPPLTR